MFQKGDYVICGTNGICLIDTITTLDIAGIDKKRSYYLLKPVYSAGSTVYIPVEKEESLRMAVTNDEAKALIKAIPEIPLIPIDNEKTVEKTYKEYVKENSCTSWVKLIKTIYLRKEKRLSNGAKVTSLDLKYFKIAEDNLYGELAIVMHMTKEQVKDAITFSIQKPPFPCVN